VYHNSFPLVSIITVVYNSRNKIEDTIKSILNQKYSNKELIIIDGGSTDGTIENINKFRSDIKVLISEKDNGIYDAMNKGVISAKGDWLIFMNSGDSFYDNDVLDRVFSKNMFYPKLKIIYGNYLLKDSNTIISPQIYCYDYYFYFETLCHQAIFFNKESFKLIGNFDLKYKVIADRDWLYRAQKKGVKFFKLDIAICQWEKEGFSSNNLVVWKDEVDLYRHIYFQSKFKIFIYKTIRKILNYF
jgi:glycosyltransferase involved in cell wall biosynthesis